MLQKYLFRSSVPVSSIIFPDPEYLSHNSYLNYMMLPNPLNRIVVLKIKLCHCFIMTAILNDLAVSKMLYMRILCQACDGKNSLAYVLPQGEYEVFLLGELLEPEYLKNDWSPVMPTQLRVLVGGHPMNTNTQGFSFQKSLHLCACDESDLSIRRVNITRGYITVKKSGCMYHYCAMLWLFIWLSKDGTM